MHRLLLLQMLGNVHAVLPIPVNSALSAENRSLLLLAVGLANVVLLTQASSVQSAENRSLLVHTSATSVDGHLPMVQHNQDHL